MANNVKKPSSTNYLTKLTSQASLPSSRNYQHHLNQQNSSPIAKENELKLVADFEEEIAADRAGDKKYTADRKERDSKLAAESNKHYTRMDARREAHNAKMYARLELLWETVRATVFSPIEPPPASVPNIIENTTTATTPLIAILPTQTKIRPNTTYTSDTNSITKTQGVIYTTTTTNDVYEMTLEEEIMQYEDEWYAAEDAAAETATRTRTKYQEIAAALDASLFEPIKNVAHITNTIDTNTFIEIPIMTTNTSNNFSMRIAITSHQRKFDPNSIQMTNLLLLLLSRKEMKKLVPLLKKNWVLSLLLE